MKRKYIMQYRRRKEGKTNYHRRKKVILGHLPFAVTRITDKNILIQLVKAELKGDIVVGSVHSRQLRKFGWPFSCKSIPACYLSGLILGCKAKNLVNSEVLVYKDVKPFIKGSRISAAINGMIDGGLKVKANPESFPNEKRVKGDHIVQYAKSIKGSDLDAYNKRFSNYVREGLDVEKMPEIFEKVKGLIIEKGGVLG